MLSLMFVLAQPAVFDPPACVNCLPAPAVRVSPCACGPKPCGDGHCNAYGGGGRCECERKSFANPVSPAVVPVSIPQPMPAARQEWFDVPGVGRRLITVTGPVAPVANPVPAVRFFVPPSVACRT